MIIAITSTGKELSSTIDPRFGRASYIIIYNTETKEYQCHDNQVNLNAMQGAGIQMAQRIIDLGANRLITGNCGPKAFRVLASAEIKIFIASGQTVEEAIKMFLDNKLNELTNPNVEGHWV